MHEPSFWAQKGSHYRLNGPKKVLNLLTMCLFWLVTKNSHNNAYLELAAIATMQHYPADLQRWLICVTVQSIDEQTFRFMTLPVKQLKCCNIVTVGEMSPAPPPDISCCVCPPPFHCSCLSTMQVACCSGH